MWRISKFSKIAECKRLFLKTNLNFCYISSGTDAEMKQFLSQSILALTSVQMREFFHSLPKKKSQSFPASRNISCFSSKFSPVLRFIFTFTQDTERAAAGERLLHARPDQQSRLVFPKLQSGYHFHLIFGIWLQLRGEMIAKLVKFSSI